jgi:hypothetical protein
MICFLKQGGRDDQAGPRARRGHSAHGWRASRIGPGHRAVYIAVGHPHGREYGVIGGLE